ncbi:MAG: M20/M25/M40 family metallo-hydrolase [Clostridia bacterium]
MSKRKDVHDNINARGDEFLRYLIDLVSQPSISARDEGVKECADLLAGILQDLGIDSRILPTGGQPVVYGEVSSDDPGAPTLICYGHYDVQPPEPLELWESAPFVPTIRNGRLFGRGTGDNKGQLLTHVLAASAWMKTREAPPVNLKFVFEGEEESGSPNLGTFVASNKEMLQGDLVLISDGTKHPSGAPLISLGNRGVIGVTLRARGADRDNHSGNKGGVAPNPAWMLIHVLANTVDSSGRVLIDGFYDDVRPVSEMDREIISRLPFDPEEFGATMGLPRVEMSKEEYYRKIMLEPYFNINGMISGYTGPGSKTIIPSEAEVRIDIRTVVDQTFEDLVAKLRSHVAGIDPRVEVQVRGIGGMEASRTPAEHPSIPVIAGAIQSAQGVEPYINLSSGGSLPNAVWPRHLGIPHVGVPYANADENNHSPNENLQLDCFYDGIHTSAEIFAALARAKREGQMG